MSSPGFAAEFRANSAAEITRVTNELRPGDVLVMTDGNWKDQAVVFRARGTAEKPITLRAGTAGKVLLVGKSSLLIDGEYLVVSGLSLKEGQGTGDGVKLAGHHCRLTDTAVVGGACKFFVHLFGTDNRMDHCYLAGKTNDSPTMQVESEGVPNRHRIDHNHFGPRPPLGRNGGETIRVGYSHQSMSNSATLVEQNLFDRCDGELEIISNKSCENVYRGNTFLDCAGMFTLRHGNRCVVEGNFFLGHHKRGSGGIRVIGEGHVIANNYIDGVEQGGIRLTAGIPNSPLVGYFQARDCLVAFNTIVDSRGPLLELDAGIGSSGRTLRPENITLANNLLSPSDGPLLKGMEGVGFKWIGNLATTPVGKPAFDHPGIKSTNAKLARAANGLWRPAADSPVRGAAEGRFASITTDMDGQPRAERPDVGADQLSEAPVTSRPLSASDVGPSWLNRAVDE
jgi:poly(beta-D-mannuronate) lyase